MVDIPQFPKQSHDPWRYPRTDYAKQVLKWLIEDDHRRLAIFAPRRRGKTTFLKKDLTPMAEAAGALVIYVDFWSHKVAPELAFLDGVVTALKHWAGDNPAELIKVETTLNLGVLSFKATASNRHFELGSLTKVFEDLKHTKKPILFLMDEIQWLATHEEFDPFCAALRSHITTQDNIYAVFTGSSQQQLGDMFRRSKAPFYNQASMRILPDLDDAFIDFELKKLDANVDADTIRIDAKQIFNELYRSPGAFTDLIKKMNETRSGNIKEVWKKYKADIDLLSVEFEELWRRLKPMDKGILKLMAAGVERDFHSVETGLVLNKMDHDLQPSPGSVQNAQKRLLEQEIIYSAERSIWHFQEPLFKSWVQHNCLSDGEKAHIRQHLSTGQLGATSI